MPARKPAGRAKTHRKTAADTEARAAKVAALYDRLEQWEGEVGEDGANAAIAMFAAGQDGYSERNAMLIAMQDPDATDVDGFRAWLDRGRVVRKGEHGINILAPAGSWATRDGERLTKAESADAAAKAEAGQADEDVKRHQAFRIATVFDVRQTDPLPPKDGAPAGTPAGIEAADIAEIEAVEAAEDDDDAWAAAE